MTRTVTTKRMEQLIAMRCRLDALIEDERDRLLDAEEPNLGHLLRIERVQRAVEDHLLARRLDDLEHELNVMKRQMEAENESLIAELSASIALPPHTNAGVLLANRPSGRFLDVIA